jgi:hypothetical protein
MLPELNRRGYLPPGIHTASIEEVIERYFRPPYKTRSERTKSLQNFYEFVSEFAIGLYINGSYITNKVAPNDVDIMVILPDDFDDNENFAFRINNTRRFKKEHLDILPAKINLDKDRIYNRLRDWGQDLDGNPKGIIYVEIRGRND